VKIDLAFITHNRLEYTKLALASVLADPKEEFSLTIWDNASSDGTAEYLKAEVKDPRIKEVIVARKNVGQVAAINHVWKQSKGDLVGKLDNDCIVTPGWTKALAQAHQDIPELGVIACWHYFPEDFNLERAKHKIQRFGPHQILRHPWTCGTGLLLKRETYKDIGQMRGAGTTGYWLRMARAGHVNGFYYPLIYQEHMDDIRSKHNRTRAMSFEEAYKTSNTWRVGSIHDQESYRHFNEKILDNVLSGSYDPREYVTPFWQRLWRRLNKIV
jgi:glycosyltransferase involved in cell wall biosynthesis